MNWMDFSYLDYDDRAWDSRSIEEQRALTIGTFWDSGLTAEAVYQGLY